MPVDEAFDGRHAPIKRVFAPDTPAPFARVMERFYVPSEVCDRGSQVTLLKLA
jgi:pyruvate/2-oxoglutarate/acetoin dehydrogenase E1 component